MHMYNFFSGTHIQRPDTGAAAAPFEQGMTSCSGSQCFSGCHTLPHLEHYERDYACTTLRRAVVGLSAGLTCHCHAGHLSKLH